MKHIQLGKDLTALASTVAATVCMLVLLLGFGTSSLGQDANSATYPHVVASVQLTGLTHPIPITTLFTPKKNGLYRVSAYMTITAPNSQGGTWDLVLNWGDDAGFEDAIGDVYVFANQAPPSAYSMYGPGGPTFRANAGVPVSYSVTASGSPQGSTYELFFTVEQLQ